MLVPAPGRAPEKKAKKKAKGARGGLRHKGILDVTSEDSKTRSSLATDEEEDEEEEEEEESYPPPLQGEGKKGRPPCV